MNLEIPKGTTHTSKNNGYYYHEREDGQYMVWFMGKWAPSPSANIGAITLVPLSKTAQSPTNCADLPVTPEEDEAWDLKTMPLQSQLAMKAYREQSGPWGKGEARIDQIGRNGNDGIAYDDPLLSDDVCEALKANVSDGRKFSGTLSGSCTPFTGNTSSHYRHSYKGIKLDPYRIARVYDMRGGPREQIMKKCLRFTDKGQTEQQVVNEIRDALDRWQAMLDEDAQ